MVLCIKLPYQHQQQVKLGFTNDICIYVCGSTHEKVIWIIIGGFLHKSDVNLSTKTYRWLIQLILGGWFFKEKTTQSPYTTTRIGGSMYSLCTMTMYYAPAFTVHAQWGKVLKCRCYCTQHCTLSGKSHVSLTDGVKKIVCVLRLKTSTHYLNCNLSL